MLAHPFADKSLKTFLIGLFVLLTLSTNNAVKELTPEDNMLAEIKDPNFNAYSPKVHDAEFAFNKLKSYYKLWYRITRAIIRKKSKVCLLTMEERQRLCAWIFICVVRELQNAKFKDILGYIQLQRMEPTPCQKEVIRTPIKGGGFWKSKKSMIFCSPIAYRVRLPAMYGSAEGFAVTPGIHVSAAQETNAVFVFMRDLKTTDNLQITNYVENLTFDTTNTANSAPVKKT